MRKINILHRCPHSTQCTDLSTHLGCRIYKQLEHIDIQLFIIEQAHAMTVAVEKLVGACSIIKPQAYNQLVAKKMIAHYQCDPAVVLLRDHLQKKHSF